MVSAAGLPLPDQQPLLRAPRPIARDEMNLAEFPLTVLSTRANPSLKTLEFADTIRRPSGEIVERRWIITGADKFGLPTASDDEVLLGLLKLTVDDGFRDRKVFFTRYELLRILRWSTEGRSYQRLQRALDRLSGVRIKASNGFYDNETKSHSTRNFGIVDAYELNDGRGVETKPSFFIWSEVLFKSFQVGFIKKLDLEFYLNLQSAVSKRLYRYLDKHFWYRARVQMKLFTLAHEKIGISRNYRYASSLRQQLDPAINELIAAGFLSRCEYVGKGTETEIVFIQSSGKARAQEVTESARPAPRAVSAVPSLRERIESALVDRGLKSAQAVRLCEGREESVLERMGAIISHFDELCTSGSALVNRSPVGFLYRAVEHPERFVLPDERPRRPVQTTMPVAAMVRPSSPTPPPAQPSLEAEYLVARRREATRLRSEVEVDLLTRIRAEVTAALESVRAHISEKRFTDTVEHGVEERLLKLFRFPEFPEWVEEKRLRR